ncbi:hypothetical protein ESCO_001213 [Escovopsis weberi]|uniref:J domain-containing protein n=1 Tax=Escovopsis weberi TaxID=150374 RepID=A0A0M8MUC6_ESCWE|nr:hypothetical protein ESCO_001213 [Escovopsis weberi]
MADDEGAAYWEAVYGQPVHVYAAGRVGPAGELEQMTEDEYAAYVRARMWEKTHAGLLEEKARREERRRRRDEEQRRDRRLREEMERSLRRGEERRRRRAWAARWDRYAQAWAAWDGTPEGIAWPVEEGDGGGGGNDDNQTKGSNGGGESAGHRPADIREEDVRRFYVLGLDLERIGEKEFAARLRDERVRWHPDKMQQRLGGRRTDDEQLIRDVTAVFQIIDKLWGETRKP